MDSIKVTHGTYTHTFTIMQISTVCQLHKVHFTMVIMFIHCHILLFNDMIIVKV